MERFVARSIIVSLVCLTFVLMTLRPLGAQVTLQVGDDPTFTTVSFVQDDESSDGAWDGYCAGGCSADGCCPPPSTWARGEYLYWWTKGNHLPALLTTGTPASGGIIGDPGTRILFGDRQIDSGGRSGLRITVGHWLDDCQNLGLEAVYFSVFDDTNSGDIFRQTTGGAGSGSPLLARPFHDVTTGQENARLDSFPGDVDGSVNISSSSELHSAAVLLRRHLRSGSSGRVDLIGGYRYFRFREGLHIQEHRESTAVGGAPPPPPLGTTWDVYDSFVAENDFHGADMGITAEFWRGSWNVELLAKVALGNIHRTVQIEGGTRQTGPPAAPGITDTPVGLLALSSNIGQPTANDFAALPEFGLNLGYDYNNNVKFQLGYTLLMLTDVARTGEQIDRNLNPTLFPGVVPAPPASPRSLFNNVTDFWVHGVNAGIMIEL